MLLSVAGIGTCCSAVSRGSDGGGSDWVPAMGVSVRSDAAIVLNSGVFGRKCSTLKFDGVWGEGVG